MTVPATEPAAASPAARPAFLGPAQTAEDPPGLVIDRVTGLPRPKKRPGRPRKDAGTVPEPDGGLNPPLGPPSIEELRAREPAPRAADRPPGTGKEARRGPGPAAPKPPPDLPPFRAGPIARGVNRLYAKAGRLVTVGDPDIGRALVSITRKQIIVEPDGTQHVDEEDITVGEAWEELARTHPRIRAFLLKAISGGAWAQLFMAHAPILLAVMMKDGIRQRIPFHRLIAAFLSDDEPRQAPTQYQDGPAYAEPESPMGMSDLLGSLNTDDMDAVSEMFNGTMNQVMARMMGRQPSPARVPVVEDVPDDPPGGGP